ncbi:MAG: hypothetical protein QM714_17700 [Nocardioides sp.]|uniref:hypothetical protein n=1 Tax=Nocardioides sp. TaxID=35761 RepID=UPI0039E243AE
MKWRDVLFLVCTLIISVALLAVAHYEGDPGWVRQHLPATAGGDGILWQVQTTFLSVGFAGLAIAAQLFAEAPLAIGASRDRVLEYIKAGWFVGVGLVANAVIAIETIWLPSGFGTLGVAILWFTPTVFMLVVSTTKLMQLFGHPSRLDEVVRVSLVDTLSTRLSAVSRRYADARRQLEGLVVADWSAGLPKASSATVRVPVSEAGRVIKTIRAKIVQQAIDSLGLRATEGSPTSSDPAEVYEPPRVSIDVEPGDRTRLGETAFRVVTSKPLDEATTVRVVRLLQSSIELEPTGSVTPDEETDREIANLKDAIGTNLRSGALATAERALELPRSRRPRRLDGRACESGLLSAGIVHSPGLVVPQHRRGRTGCAAVTPYCWHVRQRSDDTCVGSPQNRLGRVRRRMPQELHPAVV